ncbi:TIM22 inner membrane protein import complex subunit Tim8 [Schizosaccharomyces cryophilus OY26]|uniref:TIM22 inner membrane protein import complex subunit Tim8 n=1 Tax=Schizosaccharomyces cryophilus (strain OY26 / ATCC MYA-4695 / CBS 11777 / NBRC 106824 / NRRL Y48691) TaxID=653667 RepID=S9XGA3_SCHCR|nr:TIM22 inner membrane protein import complex subunit Tim8 [Schizosaccharomyces cryophilus OY26]EPY52696.1 TIM22 inner membrane protein import complex subunit Tim8 [Schizosaccharomyces cryophilus OY26]
MADPSKNPIADLSETQQLELSKFIETEQQKVKLQQATSETSLTKARSNACKTVWKDFWIVTFTLLREYYGDMDGDGYSLMIVSFAELTSQS